MHTRKVYTAIIGYYAFLVQHIPVIISVNPVGGIYMIISKSR